MDGMERPQLTVIVPSCGRESLGRTLRSLLLQSSTLRYDVIVVGDSHAGTWRKGLDTIARPLVQALHEQRTEPCLGVFYAEEDGGEHIAGQPQRQAGMKLADGRWLSWLGDDDIYLPGAFEAIRTAIESFGGNIYPPPLLFRWISPWKALYWHTPGFYGTTPGHIDAECIVTPNIPAKLGKWGTRYQGDFDFVDSTVKLHGGQVVFRPEIIAQARPSDAEDWTRQAMEVVGAS